MLGAKVATLLLLLPARASANCAVPAGVPARQILFTTDVYGANAGGKLQLLEGEPPAVRDLEIVPSLWTNGAWDDGNMTLSTVATTLDAHMVGVQ